MRNKLLSPDIVLIRDWYLNPDCSVAELSRRIGVDRNTVSIYRDKFREIGQKNPQRLKTITYFKTKKRAKRFSKNYVELIDALPELLSNSKHKRNAPVNIWRDYHQIYPNGYSYPGFTKPYFKWVKENNICLYAHRRVKEISPEDQLIFAQWRKSNEHDKWKKAVVITGSAEGIPVLDLCAKVETWLRTALKWIDTYNTAGLAAFDRKPLSVEPAWVKRKEEKRNNLMRLMHETPKQHGYNRTTWRLDLLSERYLALYGHNMCMTSIRKYLKEDGFVFKKAKIVLTSPDPKFREKVDKIKGILSQLKSDEKFFFTDEFGPFAIKMKPGWSYMAAGEVRTVPQVQKSKGCSICTAALEMSTNQVTHFYSTRKNSEEMIKLVNVLLTQYSKSKKIYISGDAASWHKSLALKNFVHEINSLAETNKNATPYIEFAWLPSSAQFLNVIESVFSGMCKSIIHNSDYASVAECHAAIDLYFQERNEDFRKNPKRAGHKIWGDELVKPVFDESQNCKDAKANAWLVDRA